MNKKIMLTTTFTFALVLMMVPMMQLSAKTTKEKEGYFQRFKKTAGGVFQSAKNKTTGLAYSARTAVGNKTSSCGTNCADGQVSMEKLSYCAFTHPRVPVCMKKLAAELANYRKHLKEDDLKDLHGVAADESKLMLSYFELMPISRDILLQMAKQRTRMLKDKSYANVLRILRKYYKPVIQPYFFQPENNYYTQTEDIITANKRVLTANYIGYIFHIDGASVAAKGGDRNAYGFVLYTPHTHFKSGENFTGTLFKMPLKNLKDVNFKRPQTRLVTFSAMKRIPITNVTMIKNTRMGAKKYVLPVTGETNTVTSLLNYAPSSTQES